jgi:hypothetical protein
MRIFIALSLFLCGAHAFSAPRRLSVCEKETEKLLAIPSRAVHLTSHREEVEAQIHEIVEHAILQNTKVRAAELRLIPHWRLFRASYSSSTDSPNTVSSSKSDEVRVDTIADEQGTLQNYKLTVKGKAQYWCRSTERASP